MPSRWAAGPSGSSLYAARFDRLRAQRRLLRRRTALVRRHGVSGHLRSHGVVERPQVRGDPLFRRSAAQGLERDHLPGRQAAGYEVGCDRRTGRDRSGRPQPRIGVHAQAGVFGTAEGGRYTEAFRCRVAQSGESDFVVGWKWSKNEDVRQPGSRIAWPGTHGGLLRTTARGAGYTRKDFTLSRRGG